MNEAWKGLPLDEPNLGSLGPATQGKKTRGDSVASCFCLPFGAVGLPCKEQRAESLAERFCVHGTPFQEMLPLWDKMAKGASGISVLQRKQPISWRGPLPWACLLSHSV